MMKCKASFCFSAAGRLLLLSLFFSGLFSRCANVSGSIEGGPRDSLPPRVVRMTPVYNATNVRPRQVVLEFDEFIQLKDMPNQFFTSPFMETKPEVTYKGKKAIVTIDSPLDSATTYQLNLGSGVVDNNEGNPAHGLKYTFSTGSHIDSMYMSGFVSDALTADTLAGAYIFFFDAALDTLPGQDSLLFDIRRAAAVARTMTDGGFVFPNLRSMDYRVYALLDKNNNQMYDPGTDAVAFQDSVRNPAHLPSFRMWYDSVRQHMASQPQTFFRAFVEANPRRSQNLTESARPSARQLVFRFAAPEPVIGRLTIDSVPPEKIRTEYLRPTRDSICYWLDMPLEELPDTIRGTIAYERPDSTGQLYMHEQELRLIWKRSAAEPQEQPPSDTTAGPSRPPTRRELRRAARAKADPPIEQPDSLAEQPDSLAQAADSLAVPAAEAAHPTIRFTFSGSDPVIPGIPPMLSFELPLRRLDRDSIRLFQVRDSTQTAVPFELEQDSLLIRNYLIRSEWVDGHSYRLLIPAGALEAVGGERNDSISQNFQAAKQADMASVTLTLADPPADYEYIVQVTDEQGAQVLRQVAHLSAGTHQIGYLTQGKIRLRLIEDRNRNGRWDTGDLVRRVQPEAIAWYQPANVPAIDLQGPVELDAIDVGALFRPRVLEDRMPALPPPEPAAEEEHDHDHDHEHDHGGHDHDPH